MNGLHRFLASMIVGMGFLVAQTPTCSPVFLDWQEDAIYAPWRDHYKKEEKKSPVRRHKAEKGCVFCQAPLGPEHNFVLACYEHCFVILNIYPYTKGHVLVIPYEHTASLSDLSQEARLEIMNVTAQVVEILKEEMCCEGFNIGINMGETAKASIPDHLHIHVMPRYKVDSGFAHLIGGIKVVAWDLEELYDQLLPLFS